MARETKLDDLIERRICDALRDGHSYAAAASAGGIAERTFHNWMQYGREGDTARFVQFMQRVQAADREAEDRAVQVLKSAMLGDDRKLATDTAWRWLARRRPAHWQESKHEEQLTQDEADRLVAEVVQLTAANGGK